MPFLNFKCRIEKKTNKRTVLQCPFLKEKKRQATRNIFECCVFYLHSTFFKKLIRWIKNEYPTVPTPTPSNKKSFHSLKILITYFFSFCFVAFMLKNNKFSWRFDFVYDPNPNCCFERRKYLQWMGKTVRNKLGYQTSLFYLLMHYYYF